jgi:hypothetical protein
MGVYVPIERKEQETEEFYNELQVIDKIPKKENITIAGDFNGRIGNQPIPECIGPNGEQVINHNGTALRDFSTFNTLKITNSFYRHTKHTQVYVESQRNTVNNNYIIINDRLKSNTEDTRVFRCSKTDSDHKLVESKFKFITNVKHDNKERDKTTYKKPVGFEAYLLEQASIRTLYRNRLKEKLTPITGDVDTDWLKIIQVIIEAAEGSTGYKKLKNRK